MIVMDDPSLEFGRLERTERARRVDEADDGVLPGAIDVDQAPVCRSRAHPQPVDDDALGAEDIADAPAGVIGAYRGDQPHPDAAARDRDRLVGALAAQVLRGALG